MDETHHAEAAPEALHVLWVALQDEDHGPLDQVLDRGLVAAEPRCEHLAQQRGHETLPEYTYFCFFLIQVHNVKYTGLDAGFDVVKCNSYLIMCRQVTVSGKAGKGKNGKGPVHKAVFFLSTSIFFGFK